MEQQGQAETQKICTYCAQKWDLGKLFQEKEWQPFPAGAGEGIPNADLSLPLLASLRTFCSFNWGLATAAACWSDAELSWETDSLST